MALVLRHFAALDLETPNTYSERVTASASLGPDATYWIAGVAQLVRAPPCHGGGRGFKSRLSRQSNLICQPYLVVPSCAVLGNKVPALSAPRQYSSLPEPGPRRFARVSVQDMVARTPGACDMWSIDFLSAPLI
jgi:hypothetical protein